VEVTIAVTLDSTDVLVRLGRLQRAMGESVGLEKVTRDSVVSALIRDADPDFYRQHYARARRPGHARMREGRVKKQVETVRGTREGDAPPSGGRRSRRRELCGHLRKG